jgi:2-dehydrotetronate isomerase
MPKLAANLSFLFPELSFLDRFAAAAAAGFKAVEFAFAYEHPAADVAAAAAAAGVETVLMNLPPGDWEAGDRGLAALAGREGEFRASLETAVAYAQACDCRQLHAMAGSGAGCQEATYLANLRYAAERLAAAGIRLLIEPINDRDIPGYFLTLPDQARSIIARTAQANLFLQLDLYHCQVMRGDLANQIESHLPVIRHFQIAGNPGRHEPNLGEISFPFLFALIDRLGYDGWIGCEYRPAGDTRTGLDWAKPYLQRP